MRKPVIALMVILFCLACGKSTYRTHIQPVSQSVVDAATLKALNDAQLDLRAAEELAFNAPPPSATASDKVTNMSKALAVSTCLHADGKLIDPPAQPDFSKKWDFLWYVDNDGKAVCPAMIKHSLDFVIDEKDATTTHLAVLRAFQATAGEFRKLNSFWYMSTDGDPAVGGLISAKKVPGGREVTGHLGLLLRFESVPKDVHAAIDITHKVRGTNQEGFAAITMRIGASYSVATVTWSSGAGSANTYALNNQAITEKDFQGLFSALGVLELIDYAKKM